MYQIKKLKSGAKYIKIQKSDDLSVGLLILCHVGSQDEEPHEYGMSHFLEHMVFKGTKNYPNPLIIKEKLDQMGAEYNAFTDKNVTGYHVKVAKRHSSKAMDILIEMVTQAKLRKKDMDMEKRVVIEEFNQVMDNPIRALFEHATQVAFEGTKLQHPTIGYVDVIQNYTNKDLKKYYKKHYRKDNMTISVSGDISKTLENKIFKHFGKPDKTKMKTEKVESSRLSNLCFTDNLFKFKGIPKKIKMFTKKTKKQYIILDKRNMTQSNILITFKIPGMKHQSKYVINVLKQLMAGSMSSRLFQLLREKWGLVYTVQTELIQYEEHGCFAIYAGTETKNCKKVIKLIINEINKLKTKMVKKTELKKILDSIRGSLALENEDNITLASYYGLQCLLDMDIKTINDLIDKEYTPNKITQKKLKKIVETYFNYDNMLITVMGNHKLSDFKNII